MIEISQLWRQYRSSAFKLIVNDLRIHDGEIVGILGANGSGKSSLLKAVMGLGELRTGIVRIDGKPVEQQYENMAFITEEGSYRRELTPLEYAEFLASFYPRFDNDYYEQLLGFYELNANEKIRTFSRGQRSKLEICAGLAKRAKHIIMDEPFLGKDVFTRQDFLKLMVSNLEGGEVILITTHLIDEIENVIDRAVILQDGFVKADVYMDDLREEGKTLSEVLAKFSGNSVRLLEKTCNFLTNVIENVEILGKMCYDRDRSSGTNVHEL